MNIVALIPARAGSKRIPGKNMKLLGGKPLIQWTIEAAWQSNVFPRVIVATDDDDIASYCVGRLYEVIPRDPSTDDEPDITWVKVALRHAPEAGAFAILRPTSPFRTAETIRRAAAQFQSLDARFDSLRAVESVKQHPGKMWVVRHGGILPICPWLLNDTPWHSTPTQELPAVYIQNSSLEMARTCIAEAGTIAGYAVAPFMTHGMEGFSIDYPEDWDRAERHLADLQATAATQ